MPKKFKGKYMYEGNLNWNFLSSGKRVQTWEGGCLIQQQTMTGTDIFRNNGTSTVT